MSKELPAVRVKVAFGFYPVGAVFRPPAMLRGMLMQRGVIELVDEAPAPVKQTKARRVKVA